MNLLTYLACGTFSSCVGNLVARYYYERSIRVPTIEYDTCATPLLDEWKIETARNHLDLSYL
jgi:hypothetical protein